MCCAPSCPPRERIGRWWEQEHAWGIQRSHDQTALMRDMRVEWSGYDVHPKWGLALHVLLFVDQIDRYLRRVPACMRACATMDEPQEHTFIHLP